MAKYSPQQKTGVNTLGRALNRQSLNQLHINKNYISSANTNKPSKSILLWKTILG